MQKDPTNNSRAVQAIYYAGGHFVLCLEDKRPLWRSWQKLRPGLDVVLAHPGPLGLKPWSISTSALDVDTGDPGDLIEAWPPMAVLNSRRSDGKHLYYSDTEGRGNSHFETYGCAGEVRSAKGYLILWHDGAQRLADALGDPLARARRWPRDLFELAGLPAVTLPAAVKTPAYSYKPSDHSRQTWASAAAGVALETIRPGRRNVNLFDAVRFWAYSVPRGNDLQAWNRRVQLHALQQNRRFPQPLDGREVIQTAYSISTWCWSGGGAKLHYPNYFRHDSQNQRKRGIKGGLVSGKVRRARNRPRDTAWRAAHAAGQSMRSIAKEYGVEHSTVLRVVREAEISSAVGELLT
ncbi:MAG: primase C-terminal domain-containing protein [Acidobacteriota bacterium]|nr:primase C-terminal domain-containing protein [Acidobacteriota bacterium]